MFTVNIEDIDKSLPVDSILVVSLEHIFVCDGDEATRELKMECTTY